jgi:hypothetical protein
MEVIVRQFNCTGSHTLGFRAGIRLNAPSTTRYLLFALRRLYASDRLRGRFILEVKTYFL